MPVEWLIGVVGLAGLIIGAAIAGGLQQYRLDRTEAERLRLHAEMEARQKLESEEEKLRDSFDKLARSALDQSNERFMRMAEERFNHLQKQSRSELEKKEQSIESLLKPVREALDKTEHRLQSMEKERKQAYGDIHRFLEQMHGVQEKLQSETRNLVTALRRPEVRGQWGEMTLKRLVELAGMVEHCDFYEQEQRESEEGRLRPDMVVRLPDERELVVDVKTPLDAYMQATEATTDEQRETALARHASKLREKVRDLSGKHYWSQFRNSPEFVILFIPGDQFLSAALERDPALLEDAMTAKVILATPSSFVALLKAVAFGWRQQAMSENADRIRDTAVELYNRLATFTEHLGGLGKSLNQAVDRYNKSVGSLERNVLPGARRFTEMGVQAKKTVQSPDPVEQSTRSIEAPEGSKTDPDDAESGNDSTRNDERDD